MANEIVFGDLKEDTKQTAVRTDRNEQQMTSILFKHRQFADKRAEHHRNKPTRIYQLQEAEIDPMPEQPLDNVQWGDSVMLKQWATSYS